MVIGLPLMWCASRLPVRAWRLVGLPRAGDVDRAARARRRRGHRGQRQPQLDRLRRAVPHPAVRAGQARAGALGRRPARPQGAAARPVEAPAGAAAAGRRADPRPRPARRRPRHRDDPAGDPRRRCCGSSARPLRLFALAAIPAVMVVAWMVSTRSTRMARITVWLRPRPADPLGNGLQAAARQVRPRVRRLVGRRARRQPGEVGRAARGAHRLHLRHHRRGARPGRDPRGARPVRRSSATPGCGSRSRATDPFVRLAAAGVTAWVARAGPGQHRRGARAAADHRGPAAAGLVRRVGAAADDARPRHAAVLRPA